MIREAELDVLGSLTSPTTVSKLADRMDLSQSHVSEIVSSLAEKELVRKEQNGKSKRIVPTESKAVELYQDIATQYTHTDPAKLLSGKAIPLLYYLDEPITVSELANRTNNYRNTVNRKLKTLQNRGIIRKADSEYVLTEQFHIYHEFAIELIHHEHRRKAGTAANSFSILWEDHESFLFQTADEIADVEFILTGSRRFEDYGIPLLATDTRHYLYAPEPFNLTPEHLICHMLLIDSGSRYQSYCLLLLSAVDIDEGHLKCLGEQYDVSSLVNDLIEYLETEGAVTTESLPTWEEFRELASQYEVNV